MGRTPLRDEAEEKESHIKNVTAKVTPAMYAILTAIGKTHDRSLSKVGLHLMKRGLEQYRKDGILVVPDTVNVPMVDTASEGAARHEEATHTTSGRRRRNSR